MTRVNLDGIQSFYALSNARQIPLVGLGLSKVPPGEPTEDAVLWALQAHCASGYGNEVSLGYAIRKSGIPRDQIFVTTKLKDPDQGYDSAIAACERSLAKLGLEYIDLYLIHSPQPGPEKRHASWKALEKMVSLGKVKSIGVSNYGVHHLKELLGSNPTIRPVIHPWCTREDIVSFCEGQHIAIEAYCPLSHGRRLGDPLLGKIAAKYSKTPAQVLIRWSLQKGYVVLPKSVNKDRIESNADVFDFDLADGDMTTLDSFNEDKHYSWNPTIAP
ncbi:hypothetical protein BGX31_004750 [Mortierella sp. GBA43]|nr:hypothetical protein BGX31_004750 [Mortierella sp. GBA43]